MPNCWELHPGLNGRVMSSDDGAWYLGWCCLALLRRFDFCDRRFFAFCIAALCVLDRADCCDDVRARTGAACW